MISDLLGVPGEHRADFRDWSTAILLSETAPKAGAAAMARLAGYLADLIAAKRREPADDLLSALIAARDGGDALTEDELTSLAFLVLVAGYENSVNLIANGVAWLLERPESLAAARAGEDALAAVVEELLRVDPPAPVAFRRFPTEDITIGGVTVPAGATVLLGIAAANRDPDRPVAGTRHADQRPADSGHLAFGHGIHYCVGAPLARLEAQVAIGTLVRRLPGLALAVPAEQLRWRPSVRTRALIELPVRW
jgi:cytochrome P450